MSQLTEALSEATSKRIACPPIWLEEAGQRIRAQGTTREQSIEATLALATYQRAGLVRPARQIHAQLQPYEPKRLLRWPSKFVTTSSSERAQCGPIGEESG